MKSSFGQQAHLHREYIGLRARWLSVGFGAFGLLVLGAVALRSPSEWLSGGVALGAEAEGPQYLAGQAVGEVSYPAIKESSGLAASHRTTGILWTHNDSGDTPRIFSLDETGVCLGECAVRGAKAVDWEDMASFQRANKSWLLIADVGDNGRRRESCVLYLSEEPAPTEREVEAVALPFRYESGKHDCEAVGVDAEQGIVLLATKYFLPRCEIYQLPLPGQPSAELAVARHVATVPIAMATAMDISADGRLAAIATYADGYLFARDAGESWKQAFARVPRRIALPNRRQGEAICFGRDDYTLFLTSERSPTPVWKVSPQR